MSLESLNETAPCKNDLLTMAIVEKNPAAVKFLLKHGADANARYLGDFPVDKRHAKTKLVDDLRTNLHDALHHYGSRSSCHSFCRKTVVPLIPASMDKIDMFRGLKTHRIEWASEDDSPTAMHVAAANGRADILEALVSHGGDVNSKMEGGYTPLIIAVLRKKYDAAMLLIDSGADVNAKSKWGKSALYYATKTKQLKMVQLLVACGVDVNSKTSNLVTALHIACEMRLQDIAELLIKSGSDVNAKTYTGVSPLHCAVVSGQNEITEMILNYGGEVASIMTAGRIDVTPLLFVTGDEKKKIAALLQKHAPKPPSPTGFAKKLVKKLFRHLPWNPKAFKC